MNRRDFVHVMTLASAAGISAVPEIRPVGADPAWHIESRPQSFTFEEVSVTCMDVCVTGVCLALERLKWDSADLVKPLLIVHPVNYCYALEIAIELNQRVAIWVTPFSDDKDAWFVAWRGRQVGSQGA